MTKKMDEMWDSVFEEVKLWYPHIYENVNNWYPIGRNEILITTDNNTEYIFNWENKTIRDKQVNLEDDVIDEQLWREQFANKLRSMMYFKAVPIYELSRLTGLSEVSLSKYLNAKSTPSVYNLERIARALRCTTTELTYFNN